MPLETNPMYEKILSLTAKYIQELAKLHLPDGAQKDFLVWVLADENPYQKEYLEMLGVITSTKLGIALLYQVVDTSILKQLIHHIILLNVYVAFEAASDHLATGLASKSNSESYQLKRSVQEHFNHCMIKKLQGDPTSIQELLAPYETSMRRISTYEQSLLPTKLHQIAKAYQTVHTNVSLTELEYSISSTLMLNIVACLNLRDALNGHPLYTVLKNGLIDRYATVNSQIASNGMENLNTLVDRGTKTILVMEVLAFCIGALDKVSHNNALLEVIRDGSLQQALYSAALLVRLLNDIGTLLLNLNDIERTKLFKDLSLKLQAKKPNSIMEFLLNISKDDQAFYLMTRIRKDIQLDEFNISLDNLRSVSEPNEALDKFFNNLTACTELYKRHRSSLSESLDIISNRIHDSRVSQIIFNFVLFHEKIYSKEFEATQGEYAISAAPTIKKPSYTKQFTLNFFNKRASAVVLTKRFRSDVKELINQNCNFAYQRENKAIIIQMLSKDAISSNEAIQEMLQKLAKFIKQNCGEVGVSKIQILNNKLSVTTFSETKCDAIERTLQETGFNFQPSNEANSIAIKARL